jgi:hypothetical protein
MNAFRCALQTRTERISFDVRVPVPRFTVQRPRPNQALSSCSPTSRTARAVSSALAQRCAADRVRTSSLRTAQRAPATFTNREKD